MAVASALGSWLVGLPVAILVGANSFQRASTVSGPDFDFGTLLYDIFLTA